MVKKEITKRAVSKTKKTVKKTITKKVAKKQVAKSAKKKGASLPPLVAAKEGNEFWLYYGAVLKDMADLRDALKMISEEQFKHHVNAMKNDFAAWVEAVLGDKKAASEMRKATTIGAMTRSVEKALAQYHR